MSIRLEGRTDIEAPIEDVFEYVTAPKHTPEWEPRVMACPPLEGDIGVGATFRPEIEGVTGTEETVMECIVYDPPTKFGYTTPNGMMGGRLKTEEAIYTFSQDGDHTRVDWEGSLQVNGFFRLLKPVLERSLRSDVQTSLTNLKSELESGAD